MKLMPCPLNGLRPVSEFQYGGALRDAPDPEACTDARWADCVFNRDGSPNVKREWWCHIPSNTWFIAERDTTADRVLRSWLPGEEPK